MPGSLRLLLLIVLTACYRNTDPGARGQPCSGQQYIIISNRWERDVDVYAWVEGRPMILGTVAGYGSGEFPIPGGTASIVFREPGTGRQAPRGAIGGAYVCR